MNIKFWGVRGSIPSSLSTTAWVKHFESLMLQFFNDGHRTAGDITQFIKAKSPSEIGGFGTATTCVQITDGAQSLIIDGGSGLKNLNDELTKNGQLAEQNEFHILLSHFHFDHIMGIPFFTPHFMKGKKIHYYSVQSETETVVKQLFAKPTFPVTFESLQAEVFFHTIRPYEKQQIQGFSVTAYKLDHPDACFGFRIEKNNKVYAHAIDHEADRVTREELGLDSQLCQNADLLYFDAQYEESEMSAKTGWGHGTCYRGFQVCGHFNIGQILFAHHDPAADLQTLWNSKKNAELVFKQEFENLNANPNFIWDYAFEGQSVQL